MVINFFVRCFKGVLWIDVWVELWILVFILKEYLIDDFIVYIIILVWIESLRDV